MPESDWINARKGMDQDAVCYMFQQPAEESDTRDMWESDYNSAARPTRAA